MKPIEQKIISIAVDQLGIHPEYCLSSTDISEFTGESFNLDFIEFVMDLEDEFAVEISDDAASKFKKIQDVIDYVSKEIEVQS